MKVFFLMLLLFFLFSCDPTTSDADKEKSNYSDPKKILHDYGIIRTMGGRNALGDPLCGGDPIGTALGWNNDIPKPTQLEIGIVYQFDENTNTKFTIKSAEQNNTRVTLTLNSDCSKGLIYGIYFCDGISLKQADYSCVSGPGVVIGDSLTLLGQFQQCILRSNNSFFFVSPSLGCNYNFIYEEVL